MIAAVLYQLQHLFYFYVLVQWSSTREILSSQKSRCLKLLGSSNKILARSPRNSLNTSDLDHSSALMREGAGTQVGQ